MNSHTINQENELKLRINYKPWLVTLLFLLGDVISIFLAFAASYLIRVYMLVFLTGETFISTILPVFWLSCILIIGLFAINRMYPGVGRTGIIELKTILRIITTSFIILGLAIFVFRFGTQFSRLIFAMSWFFSVLFISASRTLLHNRGSLRSWWGQPVVVVGNHREVKEVIYYLHRSRRMAISPVIALTFDREPDEEGLEGVPGYLYSKDRIDEIRKVGIKQVVFASHSVDLNRVQKQQLDSLSLLFNKLVYVMGDSPLSTLSMETMDLEGHPALQVQYNLLNPWAMRIKRVFDLIICILSVVGTAPVMLLFTLLIKLDSPGPALFTQARLGKNGKIVQIYKFRTMQLDADKKLVELLKQDKALREEYRKYHKLNNDPRVTRFGRFLRKTSLDELPQIWNVFKGEMSLVGPRAYIPEEIPQMGDAKELILRVSPGMTGWWQVMGRHEVTFQERLRLDKYYISNFSLWMDFYILVKTIWVVIGGKGA